MPRTSGSSDEMKRIPEALACELVAQSKNLRLRPDVDPPRRFVEDQDTWTNRQPAGEDDLLLIASREPADVTTNRWCPDRQALDVFLDDGLLAILLDKPEPRQPLDDRDRGVLDHAATEEQAVLLSILGGSCRRRLRGFPDRAEFDLGTIDPDPVMIDRHGPDDRLGEFVPTGADEAGKTDDLARSDHEANPAMPSACIANA